SARVRSEVGFVFRGTAENIAQHADLFTAMEKKNRGSRGRESGPMPHLPVLFRRHAPTAAGGGEAKGPMGRSLRQSVEARVLERYMPAHVVVTREGDVINYSTGTGKFLEPPPGRPSRALMAMARKGLRLALRSAWQEAIESGRPAVRDNVAVEADNDNDFVKITVEPIREEDSESLYLVVFNDLHAPAREEPL